MSSRFIKFIPSEEAEFLLINHPNAFLLLTLIAMRARRLSGRSDGLEIGECHIGDHDSCGLSRSEYRTALKHLSLRMTIKIIENCRNRKKSTTGLTTKGTKVKLLKSDIWDINIEDGSHQVDHRLATASPPVSHEQERRRSIKKEERKEVDKTTATKKPEKDSSSSFFYDCLKEVDIEEVYKIDLTKEFSEIKVAEAVKYILDERFIMKVSLQHALFWFCRSKKKITHPEKQKPEWETLSHKHNQIYAIHHEKGFLRNQELIKEQKMMIWQIDSFVPISLGNSIEVLKKDFEIAEKEYKIAAKNQNKIEKMEKFA